MRQKWRLHNRGAQRHSTEMLRRKFHQLTRGANHIGIWLGIFGPGGLLSIIYSVVVTAFEPIAQYGWAAIVLAGVGLTLVTVVVFSLGVIAWRVFRPIPAQPSVLGNSGAFNSRYLYVGRISVDAEHAVETGIVKIAVHGFNATGDTIFVHRVSGRVSISASSAGQDVDLGHAPPPVLVGRPSERETPPLAEFMFEMEQKLPAEVIFRLQELSGDDRMIINFEAIDVTVGQCDGGGTVRLPLWDAITLIRPKDWLRVNRSYSVRPTTYVNAGVVN